MKTEIFSSAINRRNRIRFLYEAGEVYLDPYFVTTERNGKKVVYGKPLQSNEIRKFEYQKIANIKIFNDVYFTPIIPIIPLMN